MCQNNNKVSLKPHYCSYKVTCPNALPTPEISEKYKMAVDVGKWLSRVEGTKLEYCTLLQIEVRTMETFSSAQMRLKFLFVIFWVVGHAQFGLS